MRAERLPFLVTACLVVARPLGMRAIGCSVHAVRAGHGRQGSGPGPPTQFVPKNSGGHRHFQQIDPGPHRNRDAILAAGNPGTDRSAVLATPPDGHANLAAYYCRYLVTSEGCPSFAEIKYANT